MSAARQTTGQGTDLPWPNALTYGLGTIAIAVLLNTVTTYFPAMMSTVLGQSPALAGLLLTLSKLYDIIVDLVVGHRIDKGAERMKRRRRSMLAGAVLASASFLLLFNPFIVDGPFLIVAMAAILLLYSTGYSLFAIPYVAMAPDIAGSYDGRTRLMTFRTFFSAVGQMLALAGAAALIGLGGAGDLSGFRIMGAILALVILASQLSAWAGTRNVPEREAHVPPTGLGFAGTVRQLLRNKPAVMLICAKLLQYISLAANISTGLLFKLNVLKIGYEGQAHLSLAQNIAMGLCTPIWLWAGKKFGKKACYLSAITIYGLTMLSWMIADDSITLFALLLRGVLQGVGAGGMILMSLAMLPDVMEHDFAVNGTRRDGIYSSIYAIVEKAGFALGAAVVGAYLSYAGYVATRGGNLVEQSPEAVSALYRANALLPSTLLAISFCVMVFYPLSRSALEKGRK